MKGEVGKRSEESKDRDGGGKEGLSSKLQKLTLVRDSEQATASTSVIEGVNTSSPVSKHLLKPGIRH